METTPYIDNLGGLRSGMRYTLSGVEETIVELEAYAITSPAYRDATYINQMEHWHRSITLLHQSSIGDAIDDRIRSQGHDYYEIPNSLHLIWRTKSPTHTRHWYLVLEGKPPSEMLIDHIQESHNHSFQSCICPDDYKVACEGLFEILNKRALPRPTR